MKEYLKSIVLEKRHFRSWGDYVNEYEPLKASQVWDARKEIKPRASQDTDKVIEICTTETTLPQAVLTLQSISTLLLE